MNVVSYNANLTSTIQSEQKNRNFTVDAFRLFGAVSVVILHTISSGDLPQPIVFFLKSLTRWAVPFFFIVSGYYFEAVFQTQPENALLKRLKNMIGIFISANLIYAIINLLSFRPLPSVLNFRVLAAGSSFHLWFIGSMILGYIVMWFILEQKPQKKTLLYIIGVFLLFVLATGSFAGMIGTYILGDGSLARILRFDGLDMEFSRHLISIPLLLTGYFCSKYKVVDTVTTPFIVALIGFGFQLIEALILNTLSETSILAHDFLIGTFLYSLGIFFLSMKIKTYQDNALTKMGRDYSLLLYLYHPLFMFLGPLFLLDGNYLLSWVKPVGVFALCFVSIYILDKRIPLAYRFVSGTSWR